ncbi:hypothetical protein [Photorhabdus sp. RW14-46]|uniref:hypothetical protein n=1 Tax=Photorhabdus sp. RW14-46 TaxID=2100168 RepID=UPI001A9900D3|nr:hypothetical protein [Photorhabdus sp. RW14-46]
MSQEIPASIDCSPDLPGMKTENVFGWGFNHVTDIGDITHSIIEESWVWQSLRIYG